MIPGKETKLWHRNFVVSSCKCYQLPVCSTQQLVWMLLFLFPTSVQWYWWFQRVLYKYSSSIRFILEFYQCPARSHILYQLFFLDWWMRPQEKKRKKNEILVDLANVASSQMVPKVICERWSECQTYLNISAEWASLLYHLNRLKFIKKTKTTLACRKKMLEWHIHNKFRNTIDKALMAVWKNK